MTKEKMQGKTKYPLPKTTIRAALIDMDGTLYDSMPFHAKAWKAMCDSIGLPAREEEFFEFEGMTGRQTIDYLYNRAFGHGVTAEEAERLYAIKTDNFRKFPTPPKIPGAADLLAFLKEKGIRRILVTGSGQMSLLSRLEHDFPGAFTRDTMITSHDVNNGKPSPEPYQKAIQLAGVSPEEALVIENAPLGVKSGHDSGAFTVGITTGPLPSSLLMEAGADAVFGSMWDFYKNFILSIF